ncbi:hypothetical protein DLAC_02555 [Tieghemostelium lacteum]|uniref:ATPase AAA-type core domain-containing protein n=1 Tax=Tieghemostelium lacteum TaxID=361077 RepID=A0A152A2Q8_TIELA|nr:hypothetical protein DLAC_02555 [Tieghemostelium lacteum]|eukprot:KYR00542.1 hypothetical protein DLAC_02555 [Tieghemostelium lacteum]
MNTNIIQQTTETTTSSSSTPIFRVYKDQPNDTLKVPLVEDGIIKEEIGDIKHFVQKWFKIPDFSSFNLVLQNDESNPLVTSTPLSNFAGNVVLKIQPITTTTIGPGKSSFSTNGAIQKEERNTKYYYLERNNNSILQDKVMNGDYILFHGTRSSGKTTKIFTTMDHLSKIGFFPIYMSLEDAFSFNSIEEFWGRFLMVINYEIRNKIQFTNAFTIFDKPNELSQQIFKNRDVILFIDEFDRLLDAPPEVKSNILGIFRNWKQNSTNKFIKSVVAIGPFDILNIDSDKYSPFNVVDQVSTQDFTQQDVTEFFGIFQRIKSVTVDSQVVDSIFTLTNGHPGLVNVCGRIIDKDICGRIIDKDTKLTLISMDDWNKFASSKLLYGLFGYSTVSRMMSSIETQTDLCKQTLIHYVKIFPQFLVLNGYELTKETKYLISMGFLRYTSEPVSGSFKVASCSLKSLLIKYCILNKLHTIHRRQPPPEAFPINNSIIDIFTIVKTLTPTFHDSPANLTTKCYRGFGNGPKRDSLVPDEAFYHFELVATIKNWEPKVKINPIVRTGLNTKDRADIVLEFNEKKFVLEIVAHTTLKDVENHIKRGTRYKTSIGATEVWIVHYTAGKQTKQSKYPSSIPGVGVIHIWHNSKFNDFDFVCYQPLSDKDQIMTDVGSDEEEYEEDTVEEKMNEDEEEEEIDEDEEEEEEESDEY